MQRLMKKSISSCAKMGSNDDLRLNILQKGILRYFLYAAKKANKTCAVRSRSNGQRYAKWDKK
jgi:hypothetical protein